MNMMRGTPEASAAPRAAWFVVSMAETQDIAGSHQVFRAYRYAADSPEIRGRVS